MLLTSGWAPALSLDGSVTDTLLYSDRSSMLSLQPSEIFYHSVREACQDTLSKIASYFFKPSSGIDLSYSFHYLTYMFINYSFDCGPATIEQNKTLHVFLVLFCPLIPQLS